MIYVTEKFSPELATVLAQNHDWRGEGGKIYCKTQEQANALLAAIPAAEIEAAKLGVEAKKQQVNELRDETLSALTIDFDSNTYDADAESIQRLTGAATLANAGAISEIDWITKDNKTVTLTASELVMLGGLMATSVAAIMHKGRAMKDRPDLAIIDIEAEWG